MKELDRDPDALARQITDALGNVLDPCSVFNGTRLSFVELGMVDAVESLGHGRVLVRLLLDDPVCLYTAQIHHEVAEAVSAVEGVEHVEIEIVGDRLWTAERMSAVARSRVRRRRSIGGPAVVNDVAGQPEEGRDG